MKGADDLRNTALRQMGELSPPPVAPDVAARREERMASELDRKLADLVRGRARRRTRVRVALAGLALVAVVSLVLWRLPSAEDSPRIVAISGPVTVEGGAVVAARAGSELGVRRRLGTGPNARAELLLGCKATLAVNELTTLALDPADAAVERVDLFRGRVLVSVPKLLPGHRLVIETPDATVTVHGTRFSVSVESGALGGTITRVAVVEGRVEVASAGYTEFLTAGREWSSGEVRATALAVAGTAPGSGSQASSGSEALSGSASAAAVVAAERTGRVAAASSRESVAVPVAVPVPAAAAALDGDLAEENRIFTRALQSERAGNTARALGELDELIRKYPRSPLMQSVRVEHFRLLHRTGNVAAAAREARAYLSAFPAGFARVEARRVALLDVADSP